MKVQLKNRDIKPRALGVYELEAQKVYQITYCNNPAFVGRYVLVRKESLVCFSPHSAAVRFNTQIDIYSKVGMCSCGFEEVKKGEINISWGNT